MTDTIARIAVIPGDGIGTEATPAAVPVLDHALRLEGARSEWEWFDWGCDYFATHGRTLRRRHTRYAGRGRRADRHGHRA